MKRALVAGAALAAAFSLFAPGAATAAPPEHASAAQDQAFAQWLADDLSKRVQNDPNYRRIPLDTEASQNEFSVWLHALYRQRMTPEQFKRTVSAAYPGHDYEIDFIIAALPPAARR
ncbi:MAG TPA: hypothetical protein PKB14_20145 [Rubrivivax sp.]|nr:hypothetical protein [Rubrivivax sp.]